MQDAVKLTFLLVYLLAGFGTQVGLPAGGFHPSMRGGASVREQWLQRCSMYRGRH